MAIVSGHTKHPPQPSYLLVIGDVAISIQDKQFIDGFHSGFKEFQKETVLTDQDVYTLCLKIIEVEYSGKHQAGLIVGTLAAIFDKGNAEYKCFDMASSKPVQRNGKANN